MPDVPPPKPGDWSGRRNDPSFQKGSEGERRFGLALNRAAEERGGCWVLHGLVLPDQLKDIDHLVIGPSGVTVIDAKTWDGKVWQGRVGLGRGRRVFPRATEGMRYQINRVHSRLAQEGRDDVPVTGLICMVNENEGIPKRSFATVDGVDVGHPQPVIRRALRDGPFDLATVEMVHWILSAAFRVHGGSQAPTPRPAPRRKVRPRLRAPRGLRIVLACALVATVAAAIIGALPAAVHRVTKPYRAFSRADLHARAAELRLIAVRRAHGSVRGPKVRATASSFDLAYRRGRRCRVTLTVSRAAPAFGGGRATIASTGCRPRR